MPKVRILSGNEKGAIKEMPQLEAEANISTGFAELYVEPPPEPKKHAKDEDETPARQAPKKPKPE